MRSNHFVSRRSFLGRVAAGGALVLASIHDWEQASAATEGEIDCTCPLCKTKFKAVVDFSGTSFGKRLDLKPIGAIRSPWRIPVCPKCQFVLFADKFSDDELKVLGEFVASEAYKEIGRASCRERV